MTIPRRRRLSQVRMLPQAAVHTKKASFQGTLTPQIPFQGKSLLALGLLLLKNITHYSNTNIKDTG